MLSGFGFIIFLLFMVECNDIKPEKCTINRSIIRRKNEACRLENVTHHFHCLTLLGWPRGVYKNICKQPIIIPQGNYPVYVLDNDTIVYMPCPIGTFNSKANEKSNAVGFFNCEEKWPLRRGEIDCNAQSTTENRKVQCDYKNYYKFDISSMTGCNSGRSFECIQVSESECNRTTMEMTPGNHCVNKCREGYLRADSPPYNCSKSKLSSKNSTSKVNIEIASPKPWGSTTVDPQMVRSSTPWTSIKTPNPKQDKSESKATNRGGIYIVSGFVICIGIAALFLSVMYIYRPCKRCKSEQSVMYICRSCKKSKSEPSEVHVTLLSKVQPVVKLDSDGPYNVDPGGEVHLKCHVTPVCAEVSWFIVGSDEKIHADNSKYEISQYGLIIRNIGMEDEKCYYCKAYNDACSSVSKEVRVQVKPFVTISGTSDFLEGEDAIFECKITTASPVTSTEWFKGDEPLSPGGQFQMEAVTVSRDKLTISNLTQRNAGKYYCKVINAAGDSCSNPIKLSYLTDKTMTRLELKERKDAAFVIDYIASQTSVDVVRQVVAALGVSDASRNSIKEDCKLSTHEEKVRLMMAWLQKTTDNAKPFLHLAEELKKQGEKELTDRRFSKNQYQCDYNISNDSLTEKDIGLVVKFMGCAKYRRVSRFFGLDENSIEMVAADDKTVRTQATNALMMCLKGKLVKTRRDLCNGLKYIGDQKAIDDIKEAWIKRIHRNDNS